jgi:hypothetical protein
VLRSVVVGRPAYGGSALFADLRHYLFCSICRTRRRRSNRCISTTSSRTFCNLSPSRIALDLAAPRPDDVQRRRRAVWPLAARAKIWPVLMLNLIGMATQEDR